MIIKNRYIIFILGIMMILTSCSKKTNSWDNYGYTVEDDIITFSDISGLITLDIDTLEQDLPESKSDGKLDVIMKLGIGSSVLTTYGRIEVQGSSTAVWPKKNWTLEFFADKDRENQFRLKIGDSVPSTKWIAKAEWIDPTINRNAISYGLWESMTESRNSVPKYEVDNAWYQNDNMNYGIQTGAKGFPKYNPIHINMDNEHYGISMLLLGKGPENYNIYKDNSSHMFLEFDARGGESELEAWERFSSEGIGEWIEGNYPKDDDISEEQKEAIDVFGKLLRGDETTYSENFEKHLDKNNMIDMLLFIEAVHDWDAVAQDLNVVTYDLEKWYFLPWDKDTTFGLWWDGSGIEDKFVNTTLINYETENTYQKPWFMTYTLYKNDVEERYAELRNNDVFTINNIYELSKDVNKYITDEIWEMEFNKWKDDERPSIEETSPAQIMKWFELKLQVMDNRFGYTK